MIDEKSIIFTLQFVLKAEFINKVVNHFDITLLMNCSHWSFI